MNKKEKALAKKLIKNKRGDDFSEEEYLILERWQALGMLNDNAFENMTSMADEHTKLLRTIGYPFTRLGYEEYSKNLYVKFRESMPVTIIRDILTIAAFFISLYLAYKELLVTP